MQVRDPHLKHQESKSGAFLDRMQSSMCRATDRYDCRTVPTPQPLHGPIPCPCEHPPTCVVLAAEQYGGPTVLVFFHAQQSTRIMHGTIHPKHIIPGIATPNGNVGDLTRRGHAPPASLRRAILPILGSQGERGLGMQWFTPMPLRAESQF